MILGRPIVTDPELEKLRQIEHPVLRAETIDITWPLTEGEEGLEAAIDRICAEASDAIADGATLLVLSDRHVNPDRVPIPSLLATSAVNHHLTREGTRLQAALVVESGEPREVHHLAALIGYGASAINPYLLLDSLDDMHGRAALENGLTPEDARERTIVGLSKGLLKTMSKIGISSISSYRGAQIFEAVGLDTELVERHFTGTPSRIGGIGLADLAGEALERHARAYPEQHGLPLPRFVEEAELPAAHEKLLPQGGIYQWRRDGEFHMWEPETVSSLQRVAREEPVETNGAGPTAPAVPPTPSSARGSTTRTRARPAARPAALPRAEQAGRARVRRALDRDPAPLLDRRDEPRRALARGPRDARDRDEPDRRHVEQRRGRRGQVAQHARPERRLAPLADPPGRLGPLRRRHRLPLARRPDPDQDRPGREARRGRPAARAEGRRLHRRACATRRPASS